MSIGNRKKSIAEYECFIFDMDGVLFRGNMAIKGAKEAIDILRACGKKLVFLTNNSTRAREDYAERIKKLGFDIELSEIIPATYATARYVAENYRNKRAFVIGSLGLIKELLLADIRLTDKRENADILITGSDLSITYEKITIATNILLEDKPWITTNTDKLYPAESMITPGTGFIVGSLQYITGKKPIIIGKPSEEIVNQAIKKAGARRKNCIIIGDIIESDVLAGKNAGIATALVLSGVTKKEDLNKTKIKPDYVYDNIKEIADEVENG